MSTEIPTWGNIRAEGRVYFQIKPGLIFWPGLLLSLCILSINLLGDTARDLLEVLLHVLKQSARVHRRGRAAPAPSRR